MVHPWSSSTAENADVQPMSLLSKNICVPDNVLLWTVCSGPDSSVGKESTFNAGDPGSIPGSGRSAGEGIGYPLQYSWTSLVAQLLKNLPAVWRPGFYPWAGKIPWRRERLPTPVFWPGEFHGLNSPWCCGVGHDWVTVTSHMLRQL